MKCVLIGATAYTFQGTLQRERARERTYAYLALCFIHLRLKETRKLEKKRDSTGKGKRSFTAAQGRH